MATAEPATVGELEQYRRDLTGYCYRMLGSAFEAEDAVQETMLRAWRSLDRFEGRSALKSWLYRIATNVCFDQLNGRERRARPMDLGPAQEPLFENLAELPEVTWITPLPTPDELAEQRESLRLAFVAALQHLPANQRAVLILRDVLGFQASEVADMLDTSEASVNSALQRARATLESRTPLSADALERAPLPDSALELELLGQFADAFEDGDADRIVALLTDEALYTMPPEPGECHGKEAISAYLHGLFSRTVDRPTRLVPTRANGQPAFGRYIGDSDTPIFRFNCMLVLGLDGNRVSRLTRFADTTILPAFGLPRVLR